MSARKFSAVFEIGATVAKSVGQVGKAVAGDVSEASKAVRELRLQQDKLNSYDPSAARNAGREYRALKREAEKLAKQFTETKNPTKEMRREMLAAQRAADKAGNAYESERKRLDALGDELKAAGVNTNLLWHEKKRLAAEVDRARRKMEALQRVADAGLGKAFATTAREAGRLALGIGAGVGVLGTALTLTNKATADQESLARALGVSSDAFDAWAGLAREAGFEADNVGDLIEEMNNKLGESTGLDAPTSSVADALKILGLEFEDIRDMAPEEQFRVIAKAIKGLDDQAQAVSAADILMGGEANKFFGYLRSRKEGVDELLDQQRQMNLMTNEGRAGAHAFNTSMGRMATVIGSAAREVAGLVGGALAPYVQDIAPKVSAWLGEHRDDVKGFAEGIGKALPKIGAFAVGLISALGAVGSALDSVASILGGWEHMALVVGGLVSSKLVLSLFTLGKTLWTVGSALAPLISTALPALAAGIKAVGMAVMSNPIGIVIGAAVLAVYRLVTAWEDLKKAFSVGGVWGAVKTFFGAGDAPEGGAKATPGQGRGMAAPSLPAAGGGQSVSIRQDIPITVHAAPGQSAEEVADAVMRKMDERQRDAGRGMLYDGVG